LCRFFDETYENNRKNKIIFGRLIPLAICYNLLYTEGTSHVLSFSHDPKRAAAENVAHLLTPGNRFIAPTTFPGVHNCETYTEELGSEYTLVILSDCNHFFHRIDEKH